MLTTRRMTMADKPAMLDISARIWEGNDYIPAVFDEWVADRDGEIAAVLLGERLVGCGKLTFFTPADAWLEGLRKDPRAEVKGVADAVARRFLGVLAARPGISSVRFSTYVHNTASLAANEALGFRRRAVLNLKAWERARAEALAAPVAVARRARDRVRPVQVLRDVDAVAEYLERRGTFAATAGLMIEAWKTPPNTRALLAARYVDPGRCRGVIEGGRITGVSVATSLALPTRLQVRLVCLEADDDVTADLLFDDVRLQAQEALRESTAEKVEIEWVIPRDARLLGWAAAHGYMMWEQEEDYIICELPIDLLPRFARAGTGG